MRLLLVSKPTFHHLRSRPVTLDLPHSAFALLYPASCQAAPPNEGPILRGGANKHPSPHWNKRPVSNTRTTATDHVAARGLFSTWAQTQAHRRASGSAGLNDTAPLSDGEAEPSRRAGAPRLPSLPWSSGRTAACCPGERGGPAATRTPRPPPSPARNTQGPSKKAAALILLPPVRTHARMHTVTLLRRMRSGGSGWISGRCRGAPPFLLAGGHHGTCGRRGPPRSRRAPPVLSPSSSSALPLRLCLPSPGWAAGLTHSFLREGEAASAPRVLGWDRAPRVGADRAGPQDSARLTASAPRLCLPAASSGAG